MPQTRLLKSISILFLSILVSSCTVAIPRKLYQRSTDAIAQGQYERAISGLTKAIESDPKFAEAYVNRGIAYSESGKIKAAIADYQKALELNSELIDAHYNLGNAYMQDEAYQNAIASYSEVLKRDPSYAFALGNRGSAYERIGQIQQAIVDIEAAAQLFAKQGNDQAESIARQKLKALQ